MSAVGICAESQSRLIYRGNKACFIGLLQGLSVFKHNWQHVKLVFGFVSHISCKISSVLCVIVHISTQSVVSLSAQQSLQGAEEFTQSVDLSVGGIGNCKDKFLQQLKLSFLFTRAFGISQISQICSRALVLISKPDRAHFHIVLEEWDRDLVFVCVCVCVCMCVCWGESCRADICQGRLSDLIKDFQGV